MEKQIKGSTYLFEKLDPFEQAYIVSKLTPFLGALAPILMGGGIDANASQEEQAAVGAKALPAFTDLISKMTREDQKDIIMSALSVVSRKETVGWAKITVNTKEVKKLMYDDIDMVTMLHLTYESLANNLANFIGVLPSSFKDVILKQKTPSNG